METSVPGCSAQDGVAERGIWQLTIMVRHNLYSFRLPWKLWGYAYQHAAQVSWLLPNRNNPDSASPWFMATGVKPDLNNIRAFGATVYSYVTLPQRTKLHKATASPKLLPACEIGVYIGQAPHSKGWQIWFPKRQKALVRRHCLFDERPKCDAHGRVKGLVTGNMSKQVPSFDRDPHDPHVTDRHRSFLHATFNRTRIDNLKKSIEETGRLTSVF